MAVPEGVAGIKSVRFGEYMYVGNPKLDDERWRVLTFHTNDPTNDADMPLKVVKFDGYYGIMSVRHQKWLYAGGPKLDPERRFVLMFHTGDPASDADMRWHIKKFGDHFGIQSVKLGEWVYAGMPKLDSERRHVLTFHTGDPTNDEDMLWDIEAVADLAGRSTGGAGPSRPSCVVGIQSARFGQYLYVGNPKLDTQRWRVLLFHTNTPSDDRDMPMEIVKFEGYYGILSVRHRKWLYAGHPKLDAARRFVLMFHTGDPEADVDMRWHIRKFDEGYYGIQSVRFGEWMYAGNPQLDPERKHVLTFHQNDPSNDADMRWIIHPADDPTASVDFLTSAPHEPQEEDVAGEIHGDVSAADAQVAFKAAISTLAKLPWRRGRVVLVGKGRGGKSSTLRSLLGKPFDRSVASTVGVDTANLEVDCTQARNWNEQATGNETAGAMAGLIAQMKEKQVRGAALNKDESGEPVEEEKVAEDASPEEEGAEEASPAELEGGAAKQAEGKSEAKANDGAAAVAGSGRETIRELSRAKKESELRMDAEAHVEEVAKQLTEQLVSNSGQQLTFSMWDCGGQQVFYSLIHLFFSRCSVYLCCFDLRDILDAGARAQALATVEFWLRSVRLQARGAPVILVGTFADAVRGAERWEEVERILVDGLGPVPMETAQPFNGSAGDFWFFPLDNTGPGEVISKLRLGIEHAAKEDPAGYIDQEVPVSWRQVLDQLHLSKQPYMTLDQVALCAQVNGVPGWQVPAMLTMFHELGTLLYFTSLPELKKIVILQSQWLVDAVCRLICDFGLHERQEAHGELRSQHPEAFADLKEKGIATQEVFDALWRPYDRDEADRTCRDFFVNLLEEMVLICPLAADSWLVPGLLPRQNAALGKPDPGRAWMTFWIDCSASFLPPGLFERVACLCAELSGEFDDTARQPELSASAARCFFHAIEFYMALEGKAIRVDIDSKCDNGPSVVLHHVVAFVEQLKDSFMKGLEYEVRLGRAAPPPLPREGAPRMTTVEAARMSWQAEFRPSWSKRSFTREDFDPWFGDGDQLQVVRSQWTRLRSDWPFIKRYDVQRQWTHAQKAALYQYLRDPANWGITWEALLAIEKGAKEKSPYLDPRTEDIVPYEEMNMWHVVQLCVKPVCAKHGAPLALVYNGWQPRRVEEFVTHCWAERFAEFMASLRAVYGTRPQKPVLFVCAFALYQGSAADVGLQLAGAIRDAPFVKALRACRHFVVVRNTAVDLYARAWCLVEFLCARKFGFYSQHVSITGPNTFAGNASTCLDVQASMEDDRQRVLEFLFEMATPEEINLQIQEFRKYDAGFDKFHCHFKSQKPM